MPAQTTLRLDKLVLKNFRCFADCELDLHPQLTVLVADNGNGKSALLDALAISLGLFIDVLLGSSQTRGFERTDVRLVSHGDLGMSATPPTAFTATGQVQGEQLKWSRSLASVAQSARTSIKDAQQLRRAADALRQRLRSSVEADAAQTVLPVLAYYGTGRLWSEHRLTRGKRGAAGTAGGRLTGYIDALSPSSSFKSFVTWYQQEVAAMNQPGTQGRPDRPELLVAAVVEATRTVLAPTGWGDLHWDINDDRLLVEHKEYGKLPLSMVSDGVQNMVAFVADLAHRCARLNPRLGLMAAKETPGVVIVDEVDMHLHPKWQQQVIALLQEAFPQVQMVVSTHSPQVLSTVDVSSIRLVRHEGGVGRLTTPQLQTKGVESADVLASIMGVDPVPQVREAKLLSEARALIEDGKGDSAEAKAMREELVRHFGPQHPVVLDLDRLARFQSLKLKRKDSDKREG